MTTSFFPNDVLNDIRTHESPTAFVEDFLTAGEIDYLIEYEKQRTDRLVDREESRKTSLGSTPEEWEPGIRRMLVCRLENLLGRFAFAPHEMPPHLIWSFFPLKLHADTGKDPNAIIHKNFVIPLQLGDQGETCTVIFKQRWYERAAGFCARPRPEGNDYIIKDSLGEFVDVEDVGELLQLLKNRPGERAGYAGGVFISEPSMRLKLERLVNMRRHNLRTNAHIQNRRPFDRILYEKYLSHIPYEDLTGLEVEDIIRWKPGMALHWDRSKIHCSSNFIKTGMRKKLFLTLFTVKGFFPSRAAHFGECTP